MMPANVPAACAGFRADPPVGRVATTRPCWWLPDDSTDLVSLLIGATSGRARRDGLRIDGAPSRSTSRRDSRKKKTSSFLSPSREFRRCCVRPKLRAPGSSASRRTPRVGCSNLGDRTHLYEARGVPDGIWCRSTRIGGAGVRAERCPTRGAKRARWRTARPAVLPHVVRSTRRRSLRARAGGGVNSHPTLTPANVPPSPSSMRRW